MTDDQDHDRPDLEETPEPESAPAPGSTGEGATSEVEPVGGPPAGGAGAEAISIDMSDDLRQALEEAEASVNRRGPRPRPTEVEIDLEADPGAEEDFDPNRVDEEAPPAAPPRAPTPEELELKKQILDLRFQLRAAQAEVETKVKEFKQNAEQARLLKQQFDTYKARVQREKADQFNYGHEPLLKEVLQVFDNLERAVGHAGDEADVKAIREGVEMIIRQFGSVLGKFGVSEVPAEDQPFNPEFHQAMMQVEKAGVPSGTVVEVHQKGYLLKDRLLRPAMVSVSKQPAGAPVPEAPAAADVGGEGAEGGNEAG